MFRFLIFGTWILPFAGPLLIGTVANNFIIKVKQVALTLVCIGIFLLHGGSILLAAGVVMSHYVNMNLFDSLSFCAGIILIFTCSIKSLR